MHIYRMTSLSVIVRTLGSCHWLHIYTIRLAIALFPRIFTGEGTIGCMGCDSTEQRGQRLEQRPFLASCPALVKESGGGSCFASTYKLCTKISWTSLYVYQNLMIPHCIKSELYLAKWKWILRRGPKLKILVKFHCLNGTFPIRWIDDG